MLARGAAVNVFVHKLCETWPPEFGSNELTSLEITGVANGLMVMTAGKDGMTEGILQWDIDTAFVCEDVILILPI